MVIVDFFLNIINTIKSSPEQKELFNRLHIGDIVWAEMPLPHKDVEKIEISHRVRPYLVMWKDKFNIYAYQLSSKNKTFLSNYEMYMINKDRYKNKKDSWIYLTNLAQVPKSNLKGKMFTLEEPDLIMLEKRLQILLNKGEQIKKTFDIPFRFSEGDIISDGKENYYVFDSYKDKIYAYLLKKSLPNKDKVAKRVKIDKKFYNIFHDKKIIIDNDQNIKIIDMAYLEEIRFINQLKTRGQDKARKKIIKESYIIGTIFRAGKRKIMYLYEKKGICYGVDLVMYKAFPKIIPIYDANIKVILEVYDKEKVKEIIKYLNCNCLIPNKKIKKLLNELENN